MCVEEGKADDPWRVPGERYLLSLLMMTCSATTAECLLFYSIFSYCGDRDTKYDSCQPRHCIIPFFFVASPLQCSHAPTTKSRVDTRHLAFFFLRPLSRHKYALLCPSLATDKWGMWTSPVVLPPLLFVCLCQRPMIYC